AGDARRRGRRGGRWIARGPGRARARGRDRARRRRSRRIRRPRPAPPRPHPAAIVGLVPLFSNAPVVAVRLHGFPSVAQAVVPLLLVLPFFHYVVVLRPPVLVAPALPPL